MAEPGGLLLLSAASRPELIRWAKAAESGPSLLISASEPHRLAIVADNRDELLASLQTAKATGKAARSREQLDSCLFIFSGQGSQWPGMASDLADVGAPAADTAERISRLMPSIAGRPLLEVLPLKRDPPYCP